MKKPVKIVLGLLGSLAGLLVIIVIIVAFAIDSIARKGIQSGATYALGVSTTLDKASVGLISGTFSMDGLNIDNPKGFDGRFMQLGHGGVAVSLGSLSSDTVVLPKLELSNLDVTLKRSSTGANYKIILDNLKRLESGQGEKPKEPSGPGKKFRVNEVVITNVTAHVELQGVPGDAGKFNFPIQEVRLTNVGSDGSGVDLPKLISIVLEAVLAAVVEKGVVPDDLAKELKAGLAQLSGLKGVDVGMVGKAGELAKQVGAEFGKDSSIGKKVEDAADKLKKGIGDLIPSGKKQDK